MDIHSMIGFKMKAEDDEREPLMLVWPCTKTAKKWMPEVGSSKISEEGEKGQRWLGW